MSSSSDDNFDGLNVIRNVDWSFRSMDDDGLENGLNAHFEDEDESDTSVQKVFLYNNCLERPSAALARRFPAISVLDLSNNLLRSLPREIINLVGLTRLFLRNNLLSSEDDLPKSLASLKNLRDLHLSGNRLEIFPSQLLELTSLRNLFIGGNLIEEVPAEISRLSKLRVLYLGGNRLKSLPPQICRLLHLHALIACDNRLERLPDCIVCLQRLECLQLHSNRLTTLPHGLIGLRDLTELTLKDNPLIMRFVREMSFEPSSLLELSARAVSLAQVPIRPGDLPPQLHSYLGSAHECRNPRCSGVYFDTRVEHVKFVDFCGKYRLPLMQYLCSPQCSQDDSYNADELEAEFASEIDHCCKMKKVLLG